MRTFGALILSLMIFSAAGCETAEEIAVDVRKKLERSGGEVLRLDSNKPGTGFCLGGSALVPGDKGVTVQRGDQVYLVNPPPNGEEVTVVAAQPGYFIFIDSTTPTKRFLQFDFFERNRCSRGSGGRICAQAHVVSDLNAFERFCSAFP